MNTIATDAPTLFSLLARHWSIDASVTGLAFSRDRRSLAFACADGSVAITPVHDPEPPSARYRVAVDTGLATIARRRKPPAPLIRVAADAALLHLVPFGEDGFLAGGRTQISQVSPDGRTVSLGIQGGAIEALAPSPDGGAVAAGGGILSLCRPGEEATQPLASTTGCVTALAVSPEGDWLAWADADGLCIRSARPGEEAGSRVTRAATCLSWSPCSRWLAASLTQGGVAILGLEGGQLSRIIDLPDYPATVGALAWSCDGAVLATSGAFRIIAWDMRTLQESSLARPSARETGRPGFMTVETVDVHPRRLLIGAGYANGLVVVAQPGSRDELVVREGGGAVTAMAWSSDGQHLAYGTSAGEAAIVTFPDRLFK